MGVVMGDKNSLVLYIIAFLIMISGFVMIFLTRSTTILAAGAVLIFIGLFVFLFGREKAKKVKA
jgi:heme/copper-type cytochrome/quinol oxidase subunit 4